MYEIVIGRSESDLKQFGLKGTIFLGKHYVKMGPTTSLSNKVLMDVSRSHVILVSGKRGCLTGNTKVSTNNGLKKIKNINFLNDKVYSYNLKNKNFELKPTRVIKYLIKNEELIKINLANNQSLTLTEEHPLLVLKNKKLIWKEANTLTTKDKVAVIKEKNKEINSFKIKNILRINNVKKVYDLVVPQTHNFIANKIISHNSGKSYSLGVIAEEMANLPEEIANNLSVLIFDTMGIYWTMKYPNEKDVDLLAEWGLPKKSLNVNIYTPKGFYKIYKEKKIPTDFPFSIKPSELTTEDWCSAFDIKITDPIGVLVERSIAYLEKTKKDFSIKDIINFIKDDKKSENKIKIATENRFAAAENWGLFSKEATPMKEIVDNGKVTVIDISCYKSWNVKGLVVGLICRKLFQERMASRKEEELEDVETGHSYFLYKKEKTKGEMPLVWILIDEVHEFLPKDYVTPATSALVQLLREGRQPGISLVLATQQPGEIHKDVTTQTDLVLSHRITAKRDVEALNSMMHGYLTGEIQKYLNMLPRESGAAVILDDNSEKLYPIRVRPRFTWHGGEAPTAIRYKGKTLEELGI